METETGSDQERNDVLARFYALTDARRRREREATEEAYRQRIIAAAGIDPNKLSAQGQRILRWLSEWDEWTTGGVIELVTAARRAGMVAEHRVGTSPKKVKARRQPEEANVERWGVEL